MTRLCLSLAVGLLLAACASDGGSETAASASFDISPTDTLTVRTKADSVAKTLVDAHGVSAWATAPYLRFNFAIEGEEGTRVVARHLWDRQTGAYRVEWSSGPDTNYVALVNVHQVQDGVPTGEVYRNGTRLSGDADTEMREQAYVRFINDAYWLLAPLKVFDPGVTRAYVADSSGAEHDVIRLSFDDVGLTPGDRYWLYVSRETGRLDRWAFHLQGMADDAPARPFNWTAYETLQAPDGDVHLATRKEPIGGTRAILTNELGIPASVPEDAFTNPEPMLSER